MQFTGMSPFEKLCFLLSLECLLDQLECFPRKGIGLVGCVSDKLSFFAHVCSDGPFKYCSLLSNAEGWSKLAW